MLSYEDLLREAASAGFHPDPMEKALRLLELLESLRSHPFLKERIVLKGGSALNMFVFQLPRLSVDIDLNYIGPADREIMLAERPKVEQAIQAVCGRLDIRTRRVPGEHAGGKWRLTYEGTSGRSGTLELDVSFIQRLPLWPIQVIDSRPIGSFAAARIPVLDLHELAAGKLAALFSRNAARDLFDVCNLFWETAFDRTRLRTGFVVYGGASRRDWRTIGLEDIDVDPKDVEGQLLPLLRANLAPKRSEVRGWSDHLVSECRKRLSMLMPLTRSEVEFLTFLNEQGEIVPELLTEDVKMQSLIRAHPGLRWKAQNVLEHRARKL